MAQVNQTRTPDELKDPLFNYFIAFKIPLKETDKAKIEPQIKKVLSDPKGSVQSRRLLELKADVIEIMVNDSVFDAATGNYRQNAGGRAKEAAAAKAVKLRETLEVVQILCTTRSTLLKSELKKICDSANSPVTYFTEDEFYEAIKPLTAVGVKVIDNTDTSIPFDKYQKSEQLLKPLDKKDLYEFLGCKITDPTSELEAKLNEQYKASQKISDLKKKQAISGLCSVVKELLLSSPQSRKSYDSYLALRDDVWADFDKRKTFGIKELKTDEYERYAQKIMDALRVGVAEAEKTLAVACKYFQFTVVGIDDGKGSHFEICPYDDCGLLIAKGAKSCPHCGRPLEVVCWNCRQPVRLAKDDKGCSHCGATNRAHDEFLARCRAVDGLLSDRASDLGAVQAAFLQLKNVVPDYSKVADSTIARKVKEYDAAIKKRVQEEETVGSKYRDEASKIRELIAQKKYQTAYGAARGLSAKFATYDTDGTKRLINEINVVLSAAQRLVEAAKIAAAQKNEAAALSSAVKALEACDDYTEARQILQKFPPKPVTAVSAALVGGKVRLEWTDESKQQYATYTVIKKVGAVPAAYDDGALVDSGLTIKFFEDGNVTSATPYYYAVFVERYGVRSALKSTTTPITAYADVASVQQEFVTSGVKASWTAPQNVKSIEVWKKEGAVAPLKAGDGVKIQNDGKGFYDEKASGENGYLIVCNYQVGGKATASRGVKVVFKPFEKTSPLEGVKIESIGPNKYSFECDKGYNGTVSLYYAPSRLPVQTNVVLKYIDFSSTCKGMTKLPTSLTLDGKLSFTVPAGKIGQVYPIVATEQLFVVSPPTLVNTMPGMSVNYTVKDGLVTVTGALPPEASGVAVKVSHEAFAETVDSKGETFTFTRDSFVRGGKLELRLKSDTINYVTVFSEFAVDGIKTYSQPFKLPRPIDYREAVSVLYSVEYAVSAVKPFKATIRFEADKEVEIPALLVMKGRPKPLNKNSGELCERLEPLKLKKGLFSKKYSGKHVVTIAPTAINTKLAVFIADDGARVTLKEVRKI